MRKLFVGVALAAFVSLGLAQPYVAPGNYAPTANQGGEISEYIFGEISTLNPVLIGTTTEASIIGLYSGPGIVYRDWLGTRTLKNEAGEYNLNWASNIEEVVPEQEFIVTLKEGWKWSDGTEMTADDVLAAATVVSDPAVESNSYTSCVPDETQGPVQYEKLGTYQYRATLPRPQVNGVLFAQCGGVVPAHVFMPVYEAEGAEGVRALWGVDTPPSEIVSGGPYLLTEYRSGERLVLEKNPVYGEFNMAADNSPLPGPDRWVVTVVADQNQVLAATVTGQNSFYYPTTLDQVRAVQEAVQGGSVAGTLNANLGPDTLVDFITYNFNNTDECKRELFRNPVFRRAIAVMIDRDALVEAALGGLGFPGVDYRSAAAAPFVSDNAPFEYAPEQGVEMLNSIGYTDMNSDGVLTNPETGCSVAFELQFNSGNNRRSQEALVIAQTLAPYGVDVTPREVDSATWSDSITGSGADYAEAGDQRKVDYDAQIWGLGNASVDDPSFSNGLRLGTNLNAWNKSTTDVEAWEILLERLDKQIETTLDLDERIALYKQQAELLREYLPMTPLISPAFHLYTNMGNIWPVDKLNATSAESPYRPGNFRDNLTAP